MIIIIIIIVIIIIIIMIIIIITIAFKRSRFFYNLLTAPRTVSNSYAQVAGTEIVSKSRLTNRALITCNMSCYVPHGTKRHPSY